MQQTAAPSIRWLPMDAAGAAEANRETAQRIEAMLDAGARKQVVGQLERWKPASVLECFVELRSKRARKLLKWMSDEFSLRLLSEIDPTFKGVLFAEETRAKFAKVLGKLDRDRAVRFVLALPPHYAELIVDAHPDAAFLREVMANADTAQGAMRRGAVIVRESGTIGDVIADIRTREKQIEKIDSLYVVDRDGRLTGYLKLRDLILNPAETPVAQVARRDPLTVTRETDREEVLRLAKKRKENVIAVIDDDSRLVGVIAPKELAEIARREAEEDMLLMGGVSPDSTGYDTPAQMMRRRLPWLAAGLVGSTIAATVIGAFEDALTAAAILASFIPVVMATAGNAGMQAASVSLQALARDSSRMRDLPARVLRELKGALLNGGSIGAAVGVLIVAGSLVVPIDRPGWLALTVAASLVAVVTLASFMGTAMPFLLKALGRDPAAATGIFILGSNDVFGVLIYFSVASILYL
ncbi:MAG: magnesium transporter [Rhodobacteraceae bacterium]|nr:magnesium transporter [Paracoccaceae bacterium]